MTVRRAGFPARRRQVRAPPVLPAVAHKAGSVALWGVMGDNVPGTSGTHQDDPHQDIPCPCMAKASFPRTGT